MLHITVRNRPNARFSFGKSTVLKTEDDKSYPIISAQKTRDGETDLALDKHIPLPESGKTDVALHFQPLPQDVRQFDLIEGYAYNYFKIWDITDPAYKKLASLFNSSWSNTETGEWVISLFNDYAVYDSKVWQYDKKSDKKMVLNATNREIVAKLMSTYDYTKWIGKRIQLYKDPKVRFGRDEVGGLRIRNYLPDEQEEIFCEECGSKIEPAYGMTPAQIAATTKKKYGQALCPACGQKRKEAAANEA